MFVYFKRETRKLDQIGKNMPDLENEEEKNLDTQEDVVETPTGEDENADGEEEVSTEDAKDDDGDSEDEDDSAEGDDETEDEDKPEFKKRFTQFKGDNPEEYIKNLEEGYLKSSNEGQRLAQKERETQTRFDTITTIIAQHPEIAKIIDDATKDGTSPVVDPALLNARNQMETQMEKEYNEFVEAHPELETDPALSEEVLKVMTDFGAQARKNGKVLSMKEGLRKAWVFLEKDDSNDEVVNKVKNAGSRSKPSGTSKKKTGTKNDELTDEQIAVGKKFGLTKEQLLEARKK